MSAVIPFFQPLARLLSRLWKKANHVAAAESFETALDLDSIKAEALAAEFPQETVTEAVKPAESSAEDQPVVIAFEAPHQRAARQLAQAKALEESGVVTATKTGPEAKPKLTPQITKAIDDYVLALKLSHCSRATIRNYKSDIKQFCEFSHETELSKIFTKPKLLEFAQAETDRGLQTSTVKRKLVSIAQFAVWARKGKLITDHRLIESLDRAETPDLIKFSSPPTHELLATPATPVKSASEDSQVVAATTSAPASTEPQSTKPSQSGPRPVKLRFSLPNLPEPLVTKWLPYFNLAVLGVFVIGLGLFTLRQFRQANPSLAYPTTLTRPNRVLSFQGRLTNTADSPIVGATNMSFKLFDDPSAGTQLWDSNTCSIDPDQDGIFTANLGAGAGGGADTENCGAEIDNSVFSENSNVWLQVTIGAETLTPRQPIQTVAYALNAETLQGYPASASAVENTVLVMDNSGDVVLGSSSPTLRATGDSFTVEGKALTLQSTSGSGTDLTLTGDANIVLNTNGTGVIAAQDYLAAPGATLSASYAGGRALTLRGGPSATADIMQWLNSGGSVLGRISSGGQIAVGNITPEQDLTVANNLQLGTTDGTRYLYFDNGTSDNAGIRYDSATDKMQFSNDGTTWSDMDSGVGAVTSVSNSDGSLTISPTTGVVVASLNVANANTWTGLQTFNNTNTDFAQYLRHAGDTDTFLNFTTDSLVAGVGGKNILTLDTNSAQDAVTIGDGTDIDTTILADTSLVGLFVEGSTGNVGVGTNTPGAYQLDVNGSLNLASGNDYYINGSSVLNSTTLGSSVTGSSLTSVGALSSGSIASGFGTIATANTITGTTLNGTTGINSGAGAGTQRIDSSGNLVNIGTTQFNTVTYTWPGSDGTNGFILSTNGSGTLSWLDPDTLTAGNYWADNLGALYMINSSRDLLVGGQSTESAKFAALNMSSGTPTASVSAGVDGAAYLTATGNLATTAMQGLTLGGSTTGDITLSPNNGSGTVTANGALVGTSTANFGGALTVTSGGASITGNSTITGTLGSLTGLASSGNIDFASLNAGGMVKAAATTGRLSIATGGTDYENPLTFSNGLTRTVNAVTLGGSLTGNTTIALGSNTFALSGNGSMIVGGTSADGKFQINGTADDEQLIVRANGTQTANLVEFQDSSSSVLAYISGAGIVNGSSLATGGTTRIDGSGNLSNIGTTQFNTVTYTWPGADGSGSYILSTNGAGTLSWADPSTITAGSNYWETGLGSIYLKNTTQDFLLGGQATASAKFAVLHMDSGTPTATISGTTANVATFLTGEGNLATTNKATLTVGGASTGDIQLSAHGTAGLYINSSGNVGIGDTSPTALFTVGSGDLFTVNTSGAITAAAGITSSGTITFSSLSSPRMISTTTGGQLTTSISSANLASSISDETGGGGLAVFNSAPTLQTSVTVPKVIGGTANTSSLTLQSTSGVGSTDNIQFLVGNNGGTEAMRIINSGNVGIGATAPSARLQVNGGSDIVQFAVRANGTQTSNLVEWQNSSGTALSSISGTGVGNFAGLTVNSAYTFPTADGTSGYVLSTNGSGSVTWADPNALTAASNYWNTDLGTVFLKNSTWDFLIGGQSTASAKFAFINVNDGTPTASISGITADVNTFLTGEGNLGTTNMATLTLGGATTGDILLSPNNTTGLYINGNGDAGFNTTSPGEKVEIYNANELINRGHLKFTQETAPGALTDNDSGVAGNPNGTYTYRVTFITANGETEGGTVSGGVTVASKQIDLSAIPTGTVGVVTGRNIYRTTNGGTTYYRLGASPTINDNTTTVFTDNVADGSLDSATAPTSNTTAAGFFVGGSSRLSIDQLGRVGIGTTQPLEKLTVADNADTYLKIDATGGSGQAVGLKLERGDRLTDSYTDYDLYNNSSGNFYIDSLLSNTTTTRFFIENSTGFVGIGNTAPALKLDVLGSSSSLTNLLALSNDSSGTNSGTGFTIRGKDSGSNWTDYGGVSSIITDATNGTEDGRLTIKEMVAGTLTDVITLDSGNVGIGTTPGASNKLDVYSGATQLFYVNTSKYAFAKRWYDIDNPTYYLEPGASVTSLTIAGDISMATGKSITGSGLTFGSAGVTVIGGASADTSGNLSVNGGSGTLTANKITVNTIDPPYWINGNKYATFVPSMVGVKEEFAKTVRLQATNNPKLFQYVLDFDNLPVNSEEWLFSRVIDLDQNMENLSVLVSSDSDAKVFYKKDLANRRLIFFGTRPAEISYRLTAPRFDHQQFSHLGTDTDAHGLRPGNYVMGNAPSGATGVTEADLLADLAADETGNSFTLDDLGEIQIQTTLTATPETSTVSLLDAQNQLIERFTAYTQAVIGKLRAGVIQTEHLSADSIAAPLATITQLNSEKVTTKNLVAETATISGQTKLGALMTDTATISGSLTATSLFAETATVSSARMNYLESKVAELDMARVTSFTAMTATISGTLYANNIADFDQKVANTFKQPSLIASLFGETQPNTPAPVVSGPAASSAASLKQSLADLDLTETDIVINPAAIFVKNYFEVAGNAFFGHSVGIASDLVIGDGLRLSDSELSYIPTNGDPAIFKIQPSGTGRLELMAGRLTIDETGTVDISGNLHVAGAFTVDNDFVASGSATFNQGLKSKGDIEMIDAGGARAATLSANGAFTTTSTVSAQTVTATGVGSFGSLKLDSEVLTSTGSGTVNTTKPTGKAKLSAGQTEITLKSELITSQTLIYVTPNGSTNNQVLFVKAQTAENPETTDKEGEFKVAVDQALTQDVEFTWWLVN